MSNYADLIERLRTASNTSAELDDAMGRARSPRTLRLTEAADAISRLEREKAEIASEASFLIDRLVELDWSSITRLERDYNGHVSPSLARLSALLSRTQEQTA